MIWTPAFGTSSVSVAYLYIYLFIYVFLTTFFIMEFLLCLIESFLFLFLFCFIRRERWSSSLKLKKTTRCEDPGQEYLISYECVLAFCWLILFLHSVLSLVRGKLKRKLSTWREPDCCVACFSLIRWRYIPSLLGWSCFRIVCAMYSQWPFHVCSHLFHNYSYLCHSLNSTSNQITRC